MLFSDQQTYTQSADREKWQNYLAKSEYEQKLKYFIWLLLPCLLESPGYQILWYWLYKVNTLLSSIRNDFKCQFHQCWERIKNASIILSQFEMLHHWALEKILFLIWNQVSLKRVSKDLIDERYSHAIWYAIKLIDEKSDNYNWPLFNKVYKWYAVMILTLLMGQLC